MAGKIGVDQLPRMSHQGKALPTLARLLVCMQWREYSSEFSNVSSIDEAGIRVQCCVLRVRPGDVGTCGSRTTVRRCRRAKRTVLPAADNLFVAPAALFSWLQAVQS